MNIFTAYETLYQNVIEILPIKTSVPEKNMKYLVSLKEVASYINYK